MASMSSHSRGLPLFVYGTLLSDEVIGKVLGRVPRRLAATLQGFHRHRLNNRSYPAIGNVL